MIVGVASVMTSIPKAWRPAPHGWSPDAWAMIQRRAAALGLRVKIGCHTFRATGHRVSPGGGTVEKAQTMAAHESPRYNKLYDRTSDEITFDEAERIAI
jgi:integrase/recombinase XerD